MPCFKGLAVSIHAPDGPISEFSIQKQARASRISSYIPVPPAKVPNGSLTGKPEQSTFAISITLLTPGLNVPYSTPKPTPEDPYPRPRQVARGLLGSSSVERGNYASYITPYIPRTTDSNETIAAYIYFDGRTKEEVATLLRRGEETWVNSRWVGVPQSEGGGLAEREFLFREVGLERWLNGLDLEGSKDKAARIERRQRRLEKKRARRKEENSNSDDDDMSKTTTTRRLGRDVLRYGGTGGSPVEEVKVEDGLLSSDSDSDDEPPEPEAAGQIKVALFRVIASGEIKRGEYSPQFDAHDDDEGMENNGNGECGDGDIDHTTSFAKPKALDPKSISTQTVTGLDPPDSPYAVFTFFYRSQKQLQKMGILSAPETAASPQENRRKSQGTDFSKLGPLNTYGTVGFSGYRDTTKTKATKSKNRGADAMDSDADDEDDERLPTGGDDADSKQGNGHLLSPEDAKRQGEIADGVQKIKLKRQHSAEPLNSASTTRKSPHTKGEDSPPNSSTPKSFNSLSAAAGTPPENGPSPLASAVTAAAQQEPSDSIGSPFKRHRASVSGPTSNGGSGSGSSFFTSSAMSAQAAIASASSSLQESLSMGNGFLAGKDSAQFPRATSTPEVKHEVKIEEEDEL